MFLSNTKFLIFVGILIVVFYSASECKRGGGGRRGSVSRGSTSVWGRSRQSQSHDLRNNQRKKSQAAEAEGGKKPAEVPDPSKPSAPPASSKTDVKKPSSDLPQQTAGNAQQRPIGWDVGQGTKPDGVGNKNIGWNAANTNNPAPPSGNIGNPPPPYPGSNNHYGTGTNYYQGQGAHQPQIPSHQPIPGQYGSHNTGYMSQPGPQYSGNAPMGGGVFGGNKYNQPGHGGFGGYGGGYGGYGGGYGGYNPGFGGYGMGGYGKQFGGGFGMGFGKNAVRNVVVGLLVWNLVSGFTRRPYNVYNYYNNPEKVPVEIPLPANVVVLCPENATSLCAPNTAPLCTSESAIMCVVLAQKAVPCGDNSTLKCASSSAVCADDDGVPCDGKNLTTTSVNIPCITNATIIGKVKGNAVSGLATGDKTELCVTTLALPQPEEDHQSLNQTACDTGNVTKEENNNSTLCITTSQPHNVTTQASVEKTELKHTLSK